jgi:hypothetical protein
MVIFTLRLLYPQGKSLWYPSDRRLGEFQNRSGRGGDEKNSQLPLGIGTYYPDHPARSPALYRLSYHGSLVSKISTLSIINSQAVKTYGEVEVQLRAFLASALDGSEFHIPAALNSGKEPRYPFDMRLCEFQSHSGRGDE